MQYKPIACTDKSSTDQGPGQKTTAGRPTKRQRLTEARDEEGEATALTKEMVREVMQNFDEANTCMPTILQEIARRVKLTNMSESQEKKVTSWILEALEKGHLQRPASEHKEKDYTEDSIIATHRLHTINPNKPVLCAAAPSDKKTSLCETTTKFLTKSQRAPTYIKQQQVFAAAGCFKEMRRTIAQFRRGSYTTDEVDSIMQMGAKSRKKLCKLSQGERDAVLTTNDTTNPSSYAFQIRACGELEQVEPRLKKKTQLNQNNCKCWKKTKSQTSLISLFKQFINCNHPLLLTQDYIMKPDQTGWFKRPCLRVSMGNNEQIQEFPADVATGLLQGHSKNKLMKS